MNSVYVTGHRNPDTDSIVSAMAYAALRNALGDRFEFIPARLGELNDETKLVLERFGFDPPMLLHNVRTQVQDLAYDTPPNISAAVTIHHAWNTMNIENYNSLPVANDDGTLHGVLSSIDIAAYDMECINNTSVEGIPLFNLLSSLEGHLLTESINIDAISGDALVVLSSTYPIMDLLSERSILLCGNQPALIQKAIERQVGCIIICASEIAHMDGIPHGGNTCIISSPLDAYRAMRLMFQSIPVARICHTENVVHFQLSDYIDDVREAMLQSRYRSYPVLDEKNRIMGAISRFHLIRPRRKRIILVDHNEAAQSIPGLEQAEILEIIDHHRLADVQTGSPIYFRNEPVGSTATIIASMFQEKGLMPSKNMAGLLTAAIVSDTIMFKSPTCTDRDRRIAARMARLAGISVDELGQSMFATSSLIEHSAEDLLLSDFKEFRIAGYSLGIGQVTCMDSNTIMERSEELFAAMEKEKQRKTYDLIMLMLTDVLREGSQLLFLGDSEIIQQAFNVQVKGNDVFLPGVMSRKKQIVPSLSLLWG